MAPSITHVSGTVTSDVEIRFTESGTAVCRFRLSETPSHWDAGTHTWREGTPISYICTAWRDLACNATEALTRGVAVLAKGRLTGVKDNCLHLSVDDLAVSLRQRITYTAASMPSPSAATPVSPPAWWEEKKSSGRSSPADPAADGPALRIGR
jgi:single-strand DNA-binding protein